MPKNFQEIVISLLFSLMESAIFELIKCGILTLRSYIMAKSKKKGSEQMKIYACLIGEWVCLNDDPTCKVGGEGQDPLTWYEDNAAIFSPKTRKPDTYHQLDYVTLVYKGISYRINPIFIQVVGR